MKKFRSLAACVISAVLLLSSTAANAWDGVMSSQIASFEVTTGSNFGLRVILAGTPTMCAGGPNWAYLNDTDSNYKTYIAMFMLAKAQGSSVTVFTTLSGGYCHIGYIAIS
jgi:hypothetical protein